MDRRRLPAEERHLGAIGVAGQIDQDIDTVMADLRGRSRFIEPQDRDPMIDEATHPGGDRIFPGYARIAENLGLGAVMMLERGSGAPRLSQLSATRTAVVMRPFLGTAVADFSAFASLVQIISLNRCFRLVTGDPVTTAAAISEVMSA